MKKNTEIHTWLKNVNFLSEEVGAKNRKDIGISITNVEATLNLQKTFFVRFRL